MKKKYKKLLLAFLIISVLAIILRIITAIKMSWLAEDVFFIDFINKWFKEHFIEYFFQFRHNIYPPRSPEFGNPPLALWLETLGMWIGSKFVINDLMSARLVNVIFGAATICLVYLFCRRWFNFRTALIAAVALIFSPIVIAINSSAHLDTILAFFMVLSVHLFFVFQKTRKNRYLYTLALILGLSLLVKIYAMVIVILVAVFLFFDFFIKDNRTIPKKKYLNLFVIFVLIIIVTPPVLWAGARDIDHIKRTIGRVMDVGGLSFGVGYGGLYSEMEGIENYSTKSIFYNVWMIIGRINPLLSIFLVLSILILLWYGLPKIIQTQSLDDKYSKLVFMLLICVLGVIAIHFFGGPKGVANRILFIVILVTIISSYFIVECINFLRDKMRLYKSIYIHNFDKILISITLFILMLPAFMWSPSYYNSYNNFLVRGVEGGSKLYRVGHGEGLDNAAVWIMENTKENSRICAPRIGFISKYLTNRTLVTCPLNQDLEFAKLQRADYVILHNSFMSGGLIPPILDDLSGLKPAYSIFVDEYPYITIYDLKNKNFNTGTLYVSLNPATWNTETKNHSDSLVLSYNNKILDLKFSLQNNSYGYILKNLNMNGTFNRTDVSVYGDGQGEYLSIDLGQRNKGYFRFKTDVDWTGWHNLNILKSYMDRYNGAGELTDIEYIKISIESKEPTSGIVKIKDLVIH
ncbi:MAG: glycosyltransferase family 39 protein [Nanoarchaeota archaeon]